MRSAAGALTPALSRVRERVRSGTTGGRARNRRDDRFVTGSSVAGGRFRTRAAAPETGATTGSSPVPP